MTIADELHEMPGSVPLPDLDDVGPAPTADPMGPSPEAPYGYRADGTPKKGPGGRPRKSAPGTATSASRGGSAPRRRPKARSGSSAPTSGPRRSTSTPDYRPGVAGLVQIPATVCAMVGRASGSVPMLATALTLGQAAEPLAEACQDLAVTEPAVAAVLDYVLRVGPYGALLGVAVGVGAQIATNFGVLPANPLLGTVPPEQLLAQAQAQQDEALRQMMADQQGHPAYPAA